VVQLRFFMSVCLSISLVLGQLSCVNITYASSQFIDSGPGPSHTARHRKEAGHPSVVALTPELDVEKAEAALLRQQFREENKGQWNTFVRAGIAFFVLWTSYMMLWNFEHTPQKLSSSRPYDPEHFKQAYTRQNSFTNSSAYAALEYGSLIATFIAFSISIYAFLQVRDTLPSAKELKKISKGRAFGASMTFLEKCAKVLTVVPTVNQALKTKLRPTSEQEEVIIRPPHGSTRAEDLSLKRQTLEDIAQLFRWRDYPLVGRFLKLTPASLEFKKYEEGFAEKYNAKRNIFDGSELDLCSKDLAFFLSLINFYKIDLRNSHLTDQHATLLKNYSLSLEELDIRQNPTISLESLLDNVVWAIAPQHTRGIIGFPKLRTIIFDAREDLICERGLLLGLYLPGGRKIRVSGELTHKDELREFFNRDFNYFNGATSNSSLPEELTKIMRTNESPSITMLKDSYKEKVYKGTISNIVMHLYQTCDPNFFYIIESEGQNSFVFYSTVRQVSAFVSPDQARASFNPQYYRMRPERIFGAIFDKIKSQEEMTHYLEKNFQKKGGLKSILIEFDSSRQPNLYGSEVVFHYHDQSNIWLTPSMIYLPIIFKDKYDIRLYLKNIHRLYNRANPDKLMTNEFRMINSFVKTDLREGFVVLCEELKHCDKQHKSVKKLEEEGLVTEVRRIEALVRSGFLSGLQLEVTK
jgi:hypothetical protein